MSDARAQPLALITGATSGIGREFAEQLALAGHDLVIVARDADRLTAIAADLSDRYGIDCRTLVADLSRDDAVDLVVRQIDELQPDVLVNNAGFGTTGTLARADRASQDAMLRLHVLAVHRLAQAAVQGMMRRGSGTIVIVSSVASYLTSPGNVNYCASKAFQRIYAEGLSLEVAHHGIYVQALCPGFTRTEFHARGGIDSSRYPSWMWLDVRRVVGESLAAVARRRPVVVIPALRYRVIVLLLRYLPLWLRNRLLGFYRRDARGTTATRTHLGQ
jgi:short-subunit dehydrogenase